MTAPIPARRKSAVHLHERSRDYVEFLEEWVARRPVARMDEIIARAGGPEKVAVVSVDLTVGFCHQGALASPRVAALLPSVARFFELAYEQGVRNFVLPQDAHAPDAEEFGSFPAHCVRGTDEAMTAPELRALPFANQFVVIEKNSISSMIATDFKRWQKAHGRIAAYIVVGDCTDLCIYQAAMALKLRSNADQQGQRIIVPADCVDTFDIPVAVAAAIGTEPHNGDLLHHVFLHALATNGVDVVAKIV